MLASKAAPTASQALDDPATKKLAPASTGSVNSVKAPIETPIAKALSRSATIRSVPSIDAPDSSPESQNSGFSKAARSNHTASSAAPTMGSTKSDDPETSPSARLRSADSASTPSKWGGAVKVVEPSAQEDAGVTSDGADNGADPDGLWDSTIGKAGLGKTGRVINKLVSDNDALKRDIQIEKLRAEESKQTAKLLEDKMERLVSEYESRLLEADVTKTLLSRKERQVETLTASIEQEKRKAQAAQEQVGTWKDEMAKSKRETTTQIKEANSYAALMEGRYNAISSHWKDQGDEVKKALAKMKTEVDRLVEERREDDSKIQMLRDLCDQQDGNIRELQREKEEISRKFKDYKQLQEDDLRDIKTHARQREEEQERMLKEAKETLDKLRWALNVKQNVKGAQ